MCVYVCVYVDSGERHRTDDVTKTKGDTDLGRSLKPRWNRGRLQPHIRFLPEAHESQPLLASLRHRSTLREVLQSRGYTPPITVMYEKLESMYAPEFG
jgi:hypothetical protein